MMFLYTIVRGLVAMLHRLAAMRYARIQRVYNRLNSQFHRLESSCKNDEVAMGRPTAYKSQLKLLKAYESAESARQKWLRAHASLERAKRIEASVGEFKGKKLPYTFGMIDMALVLQMLEFLGLRAPIDFQVVYDFIRSMT